MEKNSKANGLGCKFHRKLMFYVPLMYAIESRFLKRSRLGIIVWGTEYLIPVLLAFYLLNMSFHGIWIMLLAIIAVYNFYEIGYIQNDCETIKKEQNPTLRVKPQELNYYKSRKYLIYGFRLLLGTCLSWFFLNAASPWYIIVLLWLVIPFYWVYNTLRGRINLYLILPLTAYRYCMPFMLLPDYENNHGTWMLLMVFVSYPLLKFIEICSGGKSLPQEQWTKIFMNGFEARFGFRIKYYAVLTICLLVLQFIDCEFMYIWLMPMYFLVLRTCQIKLPKLK